MSGSGNEITAGVPAGGSFRGPREVLDAVFAIAEAAAAGGDLDDLYRSIHAIVGRLMPARNLYIVLTDDEQRSLRFVYFVDERDVAPSAAPRPFGHGLTEYILRAQRPLLADGKVLADLVAENEIDLLGSPSLDWMGAPLAIGGHLLGALVVQTYDPAVRYRAEDLEILSFVGREVALVLQRKQAEDRLREANRTLSTLVDNLPGVAYRCSNDLAWTMEYLSSGVRELTGWPAEELIGNRRLSFASLIDAQDRRRVWDEVQRALVERRAWTLEYRIRTADGTLKWIWERGSGIFDGNELLAIEGFFTDVTERRRAEEESARLAKERREALRREAVGRLAEGMANDLSVILAPALQAADGPASPGGARRRAAVLHDAVRRAREHTDRLLAVSRRPASAAQVVDLRGVVAGLESTVRARLPRRIHLALRLPDEPVPVRADPVLVAEVLDVLVGRACDAMSRQGTVTVAVERRASGAPAALTVSDTGSASSVETSRRLREPPVPGTGLGLAFLHSIVEQLGGHVEVGAADGGGTSVVVLLPGAGAGPS